MLQPMLRFGLRWIMLPTLMLLVTGLVWVFWISEGLGGHSHGRGEVSTQPLPSGSVAARLTRQRSASSEMFSSSDRQILFGDLHVHTTYSADAFLFSLPLFQGEGVHPPADACDFARYCSALDFFSINDHAETITPQQWNETKTSIRECNAVTDPEDPDLVAYLGWEWTQMTPAALESEKPHYGHKNVMFLETDDDRVPTRPIGASGDDGVGDSISAPTWALARFGLAAMDLGAPRPYLDFNHFVRTVRSMETCPTGVAVRDLPEDCLEGAATPEDLFAKLDDWGYESLVIPHGTSWGIHAPPRSSLEDQLSVRDHDPSRQRLFEVYSGHGSSEQWRIQQDIEIGAEGQVECARPTEAYLPCCWRAGELIEARCTDDTAEGVCAGRVESARAAVAGGASPFGVVPGTRPADWLECGQARGMFLPAFDYRPSMSAQRGLALRAEDGSTFRYGLIASSDNHKARAGPGYKEIGRKAFGDAYGFRDDWYNLLTPAEDQVGSQSVEPVAKPGPLAGAGVGFERGASFYYTGGLVAVHAEGRDRKSIWNALSSRNSYGTSGPRMLLWFDLLNGPHGSIPMGAEVEMGGVRRFEVRAVGAFEQKPGCPEEVTTRLGADRLDRLCMNECHHPGDLRHRIDRIEVVRIRKQRTPDEAIDELIEDPWRVFECPDREDGCRVEFEDADAHDGREFVYYVRALQTPTPAVNGDPIGCELDSQGRCAKVKPCPASGPDFDPTDDCHGLVQERAWSSPIFVRPPDAAG